MRTHLLSVFLAVSCAAALGQTQEPAPPHFGTTVFLARGLHGDLYYLPRETKKLPWFGQLRPVGTTEATELNVPHQEGAGGFPGVTSRPEWFGLEYKGMFWVDNPGKYTFRLTSDDGSRLYIDGYEIIDNDGIHPARSVDGAVVLDKGAHGIRVAYFQGPRTGPTLILTVAAPGDTEFYLFNTLDYLSPRDREEWIKAKPEEQLTRDEWKRKRKPADFQ